MQFGAAKDPRACAAVYLALGRQSLLAGLFRTYGDPKVAEFLRRDFSNERHQLAAEKNAYVLLGKHQHTMAAAWFVLAGRKGQGEWGGRGAMVGSALKRPGGRAG